MKFDHWFWRRRSFFFKFVNVFSIFRNYLPLEKSNALHLNKLEFFSPKDALCLFWLKLAKKFWRRRWKCEKFRRTTTTTTVNGQIFIRKAWKVNPRNILDCVFAGFVWSFAWSQALLVIWYSDRCMIMWITSTCSKL